MEYVILNYICKKILTDGGWIMNLPSAFEEKMRGLLQEEFDEYIGLLRGAKILWPAG